MSKVQATSATERTKASPGEPNQNQQPYSKLGANAVQKLGFHRRAKSLPSKPSEINGKALFWFLSAKRPTIKSSLPQYHTSFEDDERVFADLNIPELSPVLTAASTAYDIDGGEDCWSAYSTDYDDDDGCGYDDCRDPSMSEHDPLIGLNYLIEETQ